MDDCLVYRLPDGKRGEPVYICSWSMLRISKKTISILPIRWRPARQAKAKIKRTSRLDDRSDDYGLVALQGPRSAVLLSELTTVSLFQMPYYHFVRGKVAGCEAMISRTGYTGEDGFEIMCEKDEIQTVWDALMDKGARHNIQACGLGARDSLRIEACMALYGHELDDETSVLEAGLSYFCKLDKAEMVGLDALRAQKEKGRERKLVCFEMTGRGIPRQGYPIKCGGETVGEVTSGLQSPTLEKALGMGYIKTSAAKIGDAIDIEMRGRDVPAVLVRRPFYKRDR